METKIENRHGFTLIELLVVIAIVGVLASLLLPSLARSKSKAQGMGCANNIKQLSMAWAMYADDNADLLVNNHGVPETKTRRQNWVNNVLDWGPGEENTNLVYLTGGKLASYLNKATAVFKCPSDSSKAECGPRNRSMAMNSLVGNPGLLTNRFNPEMIQFFRMSSMVAPSRIYVFLDEHPDTINDGFFMNRWAENTWGNLPAAYHNGAANLSFADGHVESHRWIAPDTLKPAVMGGVGGTFPVVARTDYEWLKERSSVPN